MKKFRQNERKITELEEKIIYLEKQNKLLEQQKIESTEILDITNIENNPEIS